MILDGKKIALKIEEKIKATLEIKNFNIQPCVAFILIGEDPASLIYLNKKQQACKRVGIKSCFIKLKKDIAEEELINEINILNKNNLIDGILIQLPLPKHLNEVKILQLINPDKDVDGFHPINYGKILMEDNSGFVSCTPLGIYTLLKEYGIEMRGKHTVIMGRSMIVGKPLAMLFMQKTKANATVTVVHSASNNIEDITKTADILIVAMVKPKSVKANMIKKGCVIVDVGINKVNGKIVGDVDFDSVVDKASYITSVPGGIGPMTIASLLQNTLKSFLNKWKKK